MAEHILVSESRFSFMASDMKEKCSLLEINGGYKHSLSYIVLIWA